MICVYYFVTKDFPKSNFFFTYQQYHSILNALFVQCTLKTEFMITSRILFSIYSMTWHYYYGLHQIVTILNICICGNKIFVKSCVRSPPFIDFDPLTVLRRATPEVHPSRAFLGIASDCVIRNTMQHASFCASFMHYYDVILTKFVMNLSKKRCVRISNRVQMNFSTVTHH